MNKNIVYFLLTLITIIAFFLRVYQVDQNPPSLNWDEVSIGYNSYSILKTGKDEWGQFLPLHFKSYGEYKLPLQIYASIPGIAIFGLNEFGVRITPAVYGSLTILLLFFLGRTLFRSNTVGLIASLLLAISPWHLQLTRGSFESSFACFWVVLGIYLLVKGFKNPKFLIFSMIPMAFAVYTYNTARVFVPLYLFFVALVYCKARNHGPQSMKFHLKDFLKFKKYVIIAGLLFAAFLLLLIPFVLSGNSNARYKLVSITDDPGLIPRINEHRGNSKLPGVLPKLIHNKPVYISYYFIQNYLAHFSPGYLFISGAPHKQHHVQGIGQLYWFQAPFLLVGLFLLFKRKEKFRWMLLLWVLITHIPIAFTNDSTPHALRNLISAPFYQLVTAFGLFEAFIYLRKKKFFYTNLAYLMVALIIISGVYQFQKYWNNYYFIYPNLYSKDWQYGYKEAVNYIKENQDKYDEVIFTRHYGEPHMFTLFYTGYDPLKFQNIPNLNRFETHDWVRVLRFDKYYFPDLGDVGTRYTDIVAENPNKRLLFIGKPGDFPADTPILQTVTFLDGQKAFTIVEKR